MRKRFADASGQTFVEYIVLVAIVVTLFLLSMKSVIGPAITRLNQSVVKRIENGFKGDLHSLPFGKK